MHGQVLALVVHFRYTRSAQKKFCGTTEISKGGTEMCRLCYLVGYETTAKLLSNLCTICKVLGVTYKSTSAFVVAIYDEGAIPPDYEESP